MIKLQVMSVFPEAKNIWNDEMKSASRYYNNTNLDLNIRDTNVEAEFCDKMGIELWCKMKKK